MMWYKLEVKALTMQCAFMIKWWYLIKVMRWI